MTPIIYVFYCLILSYQSHMLFCFHFFSVPVLSLYVLVICFEFTLCCFYSILLLSMCNVFCTSLVACFSLDLTLGFFASFYQSAEILSLFPYCIHLSIKFFDIFIVVILRSLSVNCNILAMFRTLSVDFLFF